MAPKYHLARSGQVAECKAKGRCRLGGTDYSRADLVRTNQADKSDYDAFQEALPQLENYNDAHYRVYLSKSTGEPITICVQYFDYHDYEGPRFLDGVAYADEESAENAAKEFNNQPLEEELFKKKTKSQEIYDNQIDKSSSEAFAEVQHQLDEYEDAHYRVYLSKHTGEPTTVCVQYFDYLDYEGARFIEAKAYKSEGEAKKAADNYM
jgi:hypothetical protein